MVELFHQNPFLVENQRPKNFHQLIVRSDPNNIETDLLHQTEHVCLKVRLHESCDNTETGKTLFIWHAT